MHRVDDLPRSVRSVTDMRNRRMHVPLEGSVPGHDARTVVLQTIGHRAEVVVAVA